MSKDIKLGEFLAGMAEQDLTDENTVKELGNRQAEFYSVLTIVSGIDVTDANVKEALIAIKDKDNTELSDLVHFVNSLSATAKENAFSIITETFTIPVEQKNPEKKEDVEEKESTEEKERHEKATAKAGSLSQPKMAEWIDKRPNIVRSPFITDRVQPIDVSECYLGEQMKCPETGKTFRVPLESQKNIPAEEVKVFKDSSRKDLAISPLSFGTRGVSPSKVPLSQPSTESDPAKKSQGETELMAAVAANNLEKVNELLQKKEVLDTVAKTDFRGGTVLRRASGSNTTRPEIMEALLATPEIRATAAIPDDYGVTSLNAAARNGNTAAVKGLLATKKGLETINKPDDKGWAGQTEEDQFTPVMNALQFKREEIAKMLLESGASITEADIANVRNTIEKKKAAGEQTKELENLAATLEAKKTAGFTPVAKDVTDAESKPVNTVTFASNHDISSLNGFKNKNIIQSINVAHSKFTAADVEVITKDSVTYKSLSIVTARTDQLNEAAVKNLISTKRSFSAVVGENAYTFTGESGVWFDEGEEKLLAEHELPSELKDINTWAKASYKPAKPKLPPSNLPTTDKIPLEPETGSDAGKSGSLAPSAPVPPKSPAYPPATAAQGNASKKQTEPLAMPNLPAPGGRYTPPTINGPKSEANPFAGLDTSRFIDAQGKLNIQALNQARPELVARCTDVIMQYDTNRDNVIDRNEVKSALERAQREGHMPWVPPGEIENMLANEKRLPITREAISGMLNKAFDKAMPILVQSDKNRDGAIDQGEMKLAFRDYFQSRGFDPFANAPIPPYNGPSERAGIGAQSLREDGSINPNGSTERIRGTMRALGMPTAPAGSPFTPQEFGMVAQNFPQAVQPMGNGYDGINPRVFHESAHRAMNGAGRPSAADQAEMLMAKADGKGWFNKPDGVVTPQELARLSRNEKAFLQSQGVDLGRVYHDQNLQDNRGGYQQGAHEKAREAAHNLRGGQMYDAQPQVLRLTAAQDRAVGEILREHFDGAGFWRRGDGDLTAKDIQKGLEKGHGRDMNALAAAGIRVEDVLQGRVVYDLSAPPIHDGGHSGGKRHK